MTPVSDRIPPAAWATRFEARQPAAGPVCPNGVSEVTTSAGLARRSASGSSPRAASAPGAPSSTTTSAASASSRSRGGSPRCGACRTARNAASSPSSASAGPFGARDVRAEAGQPARRERRRNSAADLEHAHAVRGEARRDHGLARALTATEPTREYARGCRRGLREARSGHRVCAGSRGQRGAARRRRAAVRRLHDRRSTATAA